MLARMFDVGVRTRSLALVDKWSVMKLQQLSTVFMYVGKKACCCVYMELLCILRCTKVRCNFWQAASSPAAPGA